jgi:hypothetical protein
MIEYPPEFGVIKDRHALSPNFSLNKERFSCSKCKNILFEPVQTECGCRFCQVCIPINQNICPRCEQTWTNNTNDRDIAIEREILKSWTRCVNSMCNQEYRITEWRRHRSHCLFQDQKCPNRCGEDLIDLKTHLSICKRTLISCPMKIVGCISNICIEDLEDNMKNESKSHIQLTVNRLEYLEQEKNEIIKCHKELQSVSNHINKQLEKDLGTAQEQIIELTKNITMLTSNRPKLLARNEQSSISIVKDGKFIWQVNDILSKITQGKKGRLVCVSDPFYSYNRGYKMVLKIYPAGDGPHYANYISLFFSILKGENDDELSWPFNKTVCISLQTNNGRKTKHDVKLKPNKNDSCYGRPYGSGNVAAGQPEFISHVELIASKEYIDEGAITIHAVIL